MVPLALPKAEDLEPEKGRPRQGGIPSRAHSLVVDGQLMPREAESREIEIHLALIVSGGAFVGR